jgi:hypothetical protein
VSAPAPAPEPVPEPALEPVSAPAPAPEPVPEPAPEPVSAPAPESMTEPVTEPVTERAPEPVVVNTPIPPHLRGRRPPVPPPAAPVPPPAAPVPPPAAPTVTTTVEETVRQFFSGPRSNLKCNEDLIPEIPEGKKIIIENNKWSFYNAILASQDKSIGIDEAQAFSKKIRSFILKPENLEKFTILYQAIPEEEKNDFKNFSDYLVTVTVKDKKAFFINVMGPATANLVGSIIAVYSDSGNKDEIFCPDNFTKETPVIQLVFDDKDHYDVVIPEKKLKPISESAPPPDIVPAPVPAANRVTELLNQISCDIRDRVNSEAGVSEKARVLELRKLVKDEIEKEKNTPSAKIKAEYEQVKREEQMKRIVNEVGMTLPSEEELIKNPEFIKKLGAKLSKEKSDKLDKLFKDTYPTLYNLQIQQDNNPNQGDGKWNWPSFITPDKKGKIIKLIRMDNNVKLAKISEELDFTEKQKKTFLDEAWNRGIKQSIINGKMEPKPAVKTGGKTSRKVSFGKRTIRRL